MRQPVPFGKYLLLDRISVGGMAEVFRAKSFGVEGFEKLLAIKRILPSMADDREFLRMFVDEAKIAGQLSHPSIAQIYELGREGSAPYIAMEYVWGKDLLQIYNRFRKLGERMSTTMACHVVAKACEALDYAHRKRDPLGTPLQIVHRDCSPQNILVSYEGEVKLIDFGIAKAASRVSRTNAGVLKGKFAYLSPEQVRGDEVDRRSDLFALGTVFFECLTGERLFHSESDFATLERVRDADVPRPRDVCPELPEEVERIVLRALARNPADRYQYGSEMYRDLQAFLRTQEHPYTASAVGAWIRRAFPEAMERERQLLERYRRIGPDGQARASAPVVPGTSESEVILASGRDQRDAPADPPSSPIDDDDDDLTLLDEDEGPTQLGGPNIADLVPPQSARPAPRGRVPRPSAPVSDFVDEAPTEVHGEIGSAPRAAPIGAGAAPNEEDRALLDAVRGGSGGRPARRDPFDPLPPGGAGGDREPGAPGEEIEDLSEEIESATDPSPPRHASTLHGAGGAPVRRATSQPPPVPAGAAHTLQGVHSPEPSGLPRLHPVLPKEATASVRLGSREHAAAHAGAGRGSFAKDIGIGVAIAAVLLLGIVGVRFFFMSGQQAATSDRGTLEIDLDDLDDVAVLVDGQEVGEGESGTVSLDQMEAGRRLVEVVRGGETLCSREVTIRGGAVSSVSCAPPPAVPGALVIEGATADQVVRIDGHEVDADPAREAIKLQSGARQQVEILEDGEVVYSFFVEAAPGQLVRRRLERDAGVPADAETRAVEQPSSRDVARADRSRRTSAPSTGTELEPADDSPDSEAEEGADVGYLVARTRPWARVYIDGRDTGVMTPIAPRSKIPVTPGTRRITFVVGNESFTYRVRVEAGETHELVKDLPVN